MIALGCILVILGPLVALAGAGRSTMDGRARPSADIAFFGVLLWVVGCFLIGVGAIR